MLRKFDPTRFPFYMAANGGASAAAAGGDPNVDPAAAGSTPLPPPAPAAATPATPAPASAAPAGARPPTPPPQPAARQATPAPAAAPTPIRPGMAAPAPTPADDEEEPSDRERVFATRLHEARGAQSRQGIGGYVAAVAAIIAALLVVGFGLTNGRGIDAANSKLDELKTLGDRIAGDVEFTDPMTKRVKGAAELSGLANAAAQDAKTAANNAKTAADKLPSLDDISKMVDSKNLAKRGEGIGKGAIKAALNEVFDERGNPATGSQPATTGSGDLKVAIDADTQRILDAIAESERHVRKDIAEAKSTEVIRPAKK